MVVQNSMKATGEKKPPREAFCIRMNWKNKL